MQWSKEDLISSLKDIKGQIRLLRKKYPNLNRIYPSSKVYKDFNSKFPDLFTANELIYWYRNLETLQVDIFYCTSCGKPVRFCGYYLKHCCRHCADIDPHKLEAYKKTCLTKFGVENPFSSKKIKQKIKASNLKHYGVENPSQSSIIKRKKEKTCNKHFGVSNPLKSKKVLTKVQNTNLEKYGCVCTLWDEEIRKKTISTWNKNYGCLYTQSEEFKNLIRNDKNREKENRLLI